MSGYHDLPLECKVYVGNLGDGADKKEIEYAFSKYGTLTNVWIARNPPGFAFVYFQDQRDARDAVDALNGSELCGTRIRVDMSTGRSRSSRRGGAKRRSPSRDSSSRRRYDGYCSYTYGSRSPRREYRSASRSPNRKRRHCDVDDRSPRGRISRPVSRSPRLD